MSHSTLIPSFSSQHMWNTDTRFEQCLVQRLYKNNIVLISDITTTILNSIATLKYTSLQLVNSTDIRADVVMAEMFGAKQL